MSALEAELHERARLDPRTRLLTLDAFRTRADRLLAAAVPVAAGAGLALIDIDGFRVLNARRGASAGDAALRSIAGRLRRLVRAGDLLARTGADEIAVLMPTAGLAGAQACCERLIEGLEAADLPGAGFVTVSAGVAAAVPGTTIDALLARAAHGLDRARGEGGGRAAIGLEQPCGAPRVHPHVVDALSRTLHERDNYTAEHSACVVEMARAVARTLGIDEPEVERIASAALLHDVGKVAIPDAVLHKPGPLDEGEWALMRTHPVAGERIMRTIPGLGAVARIVRHEHERFDGAGYPDGLVGDAIPIGSRIILACDAYHAMTSDRPYRRRIGHAEAIAELGRCAGTQFDPGVVQAVTRHLHADGPVMFRALAS